MTSSTRLGNFYRKALDFVVPSDREAAQTPPRSELAMEKVVNKNIVMMGHSHLVALAQAYHRFYRADTGSAPPFSCGFLQMRSPIFKPNVVNNGDGLKLNALLEQRVIRGFRRKNPDLIVSCMLGNEYNFLAMLNHPRRFEFYLPSRPDLPTDEKAEVLPVDQVEDLIRSRLENSLGVLLKEMVVLAEGRCPLVHVPPPPPVRQTEHIEAHPNVFGKRIERLGVSPPFFRLKMWLLTLEVQRKLCEKAGVIFYRLPKSISDPDGFLGKAFLKDDPSHGNAHYGKIILDDIVQTEFPHSVMEKARERAPIQEPAGLPPLAARS